MTIREWTHKGRPELHREDKAAASGVWWDEPDKRHWVDPKTDLDCLMVRNHFGAWCGYVAVPEGHPYFGVSYDDVPIEVHGGLTFASLCRESEDGEGHGICHVPLPGRPDRVWWLGFDCGHCFDFQPTLNISTPADLADLMDGTYRTTAYVQHECEELARQLREAHG